MDRTDATDRSPPLVERAVFASGVLLLGIDNAREIDGRIEYAKANDVPLADTLVPLSTGMLLFGCLGIVLWRVPRLAAGAIAAFMVGVTPQMHDFWNYEEEERQSQKIHFLKNVSILGGALAYLSR